MLFLSRLQHLSAALFQRPQLASQADSEAACSARQYELALLDLLARGFLTIDQVMERLPLQGTRPKSR